MHANLARRVPLGLGDGLCYALLTLDGYEIGQCHAPVLCSEVNFWSLVGTGLRLEVRPLVEAED